MHPIAPPFTLARVPPVDPAARHRALVLALQAHAHRYYVLDDPTVTDAEYDLLYRELVALETAHPQLVTPTSPTQRIGGEPRGDLLRHERPERMYSLDNAYSRDDLALFDERVRKGLPDGEDIVYVAEPKLDGASLEVVYRVDRAANLATLAMATTRGDGKVGEIVTENVKTIRGLPLVIELEPAVAAATDQLTVRGEVIIHRAELAAVNVEREAAGEEPFANPRNAASGSLRMLDPRVVARRPLRISLYQLVEGPTLFATHRESLAWMARARLPTHRREVTGRTVDELWATIQELDRARASYPFETDGVVLKVDAYRQQQILGETSKFPRWATAYKFAPERARTRVLAIEVQVGRTGALTPVATLEPVVLAGTTVERASLHNFDRVAAIDVRVGSTVDIEKAGEIIPQVMAVIDRGEGPPTVAPTRCPVCETPVVREEGEVALRCPNRRCPAAVRAAVHYFTRRTQMDVDHLGHSLIEQLVVHGLIADVADLYDLDVERLVALERMAEKSATNVVASLQRSKERPFDRLLAALGIPQIGQVAARQLAETIPSLDALIALGPDGVAAAAETIHGFGPAMVDAVRAWVADPVNLALLGKLQARGVSRPFVRAAVATSGPLLGVKICVTGVLSRKREDVHADIRAAGGEVHDAVKVDTTYLLAGEKTGASKLDAARKRGAAVIDEATLGAILRGELAALAPAEASRALVADALAAKEKASTDARDLKEAKKKEAAEKKKQAAESKKEKAAKKKAPDAPPSAQPELFAPTAAPAGQSADTKK